MRAFALAVLGATDSAGSSGYLSVKVYLSPPLTTAVHVALTSSSMRAYGATVRPGLVRVQHIYSTPPGQAALSLWHVQHAGGWYA